MKDTQKAFLEKFELTTYHEQCRKLTDPKKKKKEIDQVIELVEQYDFYFKQLLMSEIIRDQSLDKQPELRSTIRLKVLLPKIE